MDTNDIIDVIAGALSSGQSVRAPAPTAAPAVAAGHGSVRGPSHKAGFYARGDYNRPFTSLKSGRPFISEYDLRVMLKTNPSSVNVPKNAIISPLALEIIQEKNITINYV